MDEKGTRTTEAFEKAVVAWRRRLLLRAGLGEPWVELVANETAIDLHELLGLVEGGCAPLTAVRILAPLAWPERWARPPGDRS